MVWNNPGWLALTAKTEPSADASNRACPSPAILKNRDFDREREKEILRKTTRTIARIILLLTCILTLAVSNGKVAKSAMQAAVPAVSNLRPSEKSSDVPCFMMRLFFSLSLLLPLMRVVKGVHGMCRTVQDSWISLRLIFSSRDESTIPQVRLSSSSKGFLLFSLQNSMYTIYKVLLEDKQEPSDIHPTVVLKARFPEMIGISVESSRSRALVFDFLMVNFFIHTIFLWTKAMWENV